MTLVPGGTDIVKTSPILLTEQTGLFTMVEVAIDQRVTAVRHDSFFVRPSPRSIPELSCEHELKFF